MKTPTDVIEVVPALELRDVHAKYNEIEVLRGMTLQVPKGQVVALLGTNGAGKTTTLRAISHHLSKQLRVTSGSIFFEGKNGRKADSASLSKAGMCLVPEGRGVFPNLTVAENLWMWTHCKRGNRSRIEDEAYERFPVLSKRRGQLAGTLSGGEQQMLALSRALATSPSLLLIDELSMGLAPALVAELYEVVKTVADGGTSMLLVEQSITTALAVADTVAIVSRGRVQRMGTPDEIAEVALELYLS